MRARDIMTTPVVALAPSASLAEAVRLMAGHGFAALPVVDARGRVVGLVSEENLTRAGWSPDDGTTLGRPRTAAAVMRTPGVAAPADLDVAHLGHRMAEARVRTLPVLDEGVLIGMVTFQDVLRALPAARLS